MNSIEAAQSAAQELLIQFPLLTFQVKLASEVDPDMARLRNRPSKQEVRLLGQTG